MGNKGTQSNGAAAILVDRAPTANVRLMRCTDGDDARARLYKRAGRIIKLLTVQEILDEEHAQEM